LHSANQKIDVTSLRTTKYSYCQGHSDFVNAHALLVWKNYDTRLSTRHVICRQTCAQCESTITVMPATLRSRLIHSLGSYVWQLAR